MDIDLDTLKREILEYLDTSGFAIFRSSPGGLEGLPIILWDTERYPDYQMFVGVAKSLASKLILFASRELESSEIDETLEQLEDCDLTREERRDYEKRLRELRAYEGVTCSLELAFDYHARLYVYEVRPDWYDELIDIGDEIALQLPSEGEDEEDDSLGGYFSKN